MMDSGSARRKVVLDIEATGESRRRESRICEIAAIEFDELYRPVACFQQYLTAPDD